MTKLFNDSLVNLKNDVVIVDVDSKPSSPQSGVACRSCGCELIKLQGSVMWQCTGCNTQYQDKLYAKGDEGEITTSDGTSEIEKGSGDIISVDPYELYTKQSMSAADSRKRYRSQIFGRLPSGAKIVDRDESSQIR